MNLEHSNIESGTSVLAADEHLAADYEAPAIESVLTPEDLEREVHYAGLVAVSGFAGA